MALYSFDPTGSFAANKIQNELHTVNTINGVDRNYIVPVNAPYFAPSLTVWDMATGMELVANQDYIHVFEFAQASEATGIDVAGGFAFVNPNRNGSYRISYQTLGGDYVSTETQVIESGLDTLYNLESMSWQQINPATIPSVFPPTPHLQRLDSVVGIADILGAFKELEYAIKNADKTISVGDVIDLEEQYIEPMRQSMGSIAGAISVLAASRNMLYAEDTTGFSLRTHPSLAEDAWLDTGTAITIETPGTYQVSFGGNPTATVTSGRATLLMRYVVDGVRVSTSNISGSTVGLDAGMVVKTQVSVLYENASDVVLAGPNNTCGLTVLYVGA